MKYRYILIFKSKYRGIFIPRYRHKEMLSHPCLLKQGNYKKILTLIGLKS